MNTNKKRLIFTVMGSIVVVLVLLFGGAVGTVFASQNSLPGDALYPVKKSIEQTRLSFANDAQSRAQLSVAFAERRMQEVAGLIQEDRFTNITDTTREFEKSINQALVELEIVAKTDPERASLMAVQVSEALSRFARTMNSMLESVPSPVKAEMEMSISSAQADDSPDGSTSETEFTGYVKSITQGAWIIGGKTIFIHSQTELKDTIQVGDFVKVHASMNGDGDFVAREIELSVDGEDLANSNDNLNGNDNTNTNINGVDDNGGNTNTNVNTNSANDNGNVPGNSNNNTNDDKGGKSGKGGNN